MPEPYEIHEVQPEWMLRPEAMGSKTKFWYRRPGEQKRDWLFKFPQPNTGQHWAEKIAAQVARVLGIRHARVELAVFGGNRGSVTESFARGGRDLWHGNQVLAGSVQGYDPDAKFRQSNHSLSNIWQALDGIFEDPGAARQAKITITDYIVLDALIGNTDRHHENWGILRKRVGERWRGSMAPSFDHASSLGRELLDARRDLLLAEDRIGRYAARGRGGIYWSDTDEHAPSPLGTGAACFSHRSRPPSARARQTANAERAIGPRGDRRCTRVLDELSGPTVRSRADALQSERVTEVDLMSAKALFLAWQDKNRSRQWFPVGRLDADIERSKFRFRYTGGAERARREVGFPLAIDFPTMRDDYWSCELFPLFKNRVMAPGRPDLADYLKTLDLTEKADPVEILSVDGGYRITDALRSVSKDREGRRRRLPVPLFLTWLASR